MEKNHYRVIGIDHGTVRIGIAMSDETGTIAFGKQAIPNDNKSLNKIIDLVKENNAVKIIIGYPLNLKGNKTAQTAEVDKFIASLKEMLNKQSVDAAVIEWDERFTSKMALDSMLESGMKKKNRQNKSNLDIISAAIMLQSYLDSSGGK
ncbi:MAG: Holliday junction resolvase RuvX [Ignavibacteriae bacterium]|nr:MAG: Holliday junction resolvase RuvX [Ignavibacteriota bacterium]